MATTSGRVSSFLTIIFYYYFYVRYGGGPLVTSLETCEKCNVSKCSLVISDYIFSVQAYFAELKKRRKDETEKVNEVTRTH